MRRLAIIAAQPRHGRARPDDRDRPCRLQRQHPVILQQRDRSLRRRARQRPRLAVVGDRLRLRRIGIGMFEQPGAKFQFQHPPHRFVDLRLADLARAHLRAQRGVGQPVGQVRVDARVQRAPGRFLQAAGDMMDAHQLVDTRIIGHHRAAEAPFPAQHIAQQPAVHMARHAVNLVIARHHRIDAGALHHLREGRKEILAQLALRHRGRPHIGAAFGLAMAGQMLERREHLAGAQIARPAGPLQPLDRSDPHLADQIGVLTIGFLDPPPTRVARDVDHGRQHHRHAARPYLAGDHAVHLPHQGRVPGGRQRDRLGKAGRAHRCIAMQPFFMKQDRDAQACLSHRPFLQRIDQRHGLARITAARHARADRAFGVGWPREMSQAMGIARRQLGHIKLQPIVEDLDLAFPNGGDLRDLLVQRHARDQVVDARLHRRGRILVERPLILRRAGWLHGRERRRHPDRQQGCSAQNLAATDHLAPLPFFSPDTLFACDA